MKLRPATFKDADFLLRLRNDSDTVRNSLNCNTVGEAAHHVWLQAVLQNPEVELFIAEVRSAINFDQQWRIGERFARVGTGRLQYGDDHAELSITVAPEWRGHGYGQEIIRLLKERAREKGKPSRALVRSENTASLIAFLKSGFKPTEGIWILTGS